MWEIKGGIVSKIQKYMMLFWGIRISKTQDTADQSFLVMWWGSPYLVLWTNPDPSLSSWASAPPKKGEMCWLGDGNETNLTLDFNSSLHFSTAVLLQTYIEYVFVLPTFSSLFVSKSDRILNWVASNYLCFDFWRSIHIWAAQASGSLTMVSTDPQCECKYTLLGE